jgi:TonB-dependent starch-binding outer membrane protein SusC
MKKKNLIGFKATNALKNICLLTCLTIFTTPTAFASSWVERDVEYVSSKKENKTLGEVFSYIEKHGNYVFVYQTSIVNLSTQTSVSLDKRPATKILDEALIGTGLSYLVKGKQIIIKKEEHKGKKESVAASNNVSREKITVKGNVKDEFGASLAGINVTVKGSTQGIITDENGNFTLQNVPSLAVLNFSCIGYQSKEMSAKESLALVMKEDKTLLNEVVVVGYGSQEKKDLTGSIGKIESKDFKQGITTSADNLLQGKMAGVRIINSSGEPGGGVNVQIRGLGSIRSGSTPLFVVDGVPLSNDEVTPTAADMGFGSSAAKNPLNFLNTSDIESITVLKDASAAAIYGARGSNGVVLITTKKGKEGDAVLSFNSYLALSDLPKKINMLSHAEFISAVGEESSYNHGGNTDWQDEVFRTAVTQNAELSFAKKTSTGNYYASIGHINQEGIIQNSKFARTSARLNAEESFFDNQRLKIKINMGVSQMNENGVPSADSGGSDGQLITHTLMSNPTFSVYDEDGNYTNFNLNQCFNPMYLLYIYEDETSTLRLVGNVEASFRLFKGLTYKLNYAIDRSTSERNTTMYKNSTTINTNGKYTESHLDNKSELIEHYLTYDLTKDKHRLNLLGGFSYQKYNTEATGFTVVGLNEKGVGIKPKYNPDYTSYTSSDISGSAQENELQSFFVRTNYSFDSKYMLTASLRADGSTRFGEDKKYGYFPSFALGWNISQEKFMKSATFVDNLKLRGSWGQTGNQEVENKITKASYSLSSGSGYNLTDGTVTNGISVNRTANPDLHWEVVTQQDLGVDFNLFKNKIYGSIDYYNKVTTDAILYLPSSVLSATDYVWRNVDAKIINSGFEFNVGCNIVDNKKWHWNVDVNATTLNNVVKDLPVSELYSGSISGPGQSGVMANIYKSNYEVGSFYLYKQIGFNEDGSEKFQDKDDDGSITSNDRYIVEGALPNFTYGINSDISYENFDLSFSIIGQAGAYLYNNTCFTACNINNLESDRNVLKDYYNSGASSSNSPLISTYYLEKSDFIRLNTVKLSYNFNIKDIKWIKEMNVYLTGQNLLTITGYKGFDPLANADKSSGGNQSVGIDYTSYPNARSYMLGLTMKF